MRSIRVVSLVVAVAGCLGIGASAHAESGSDQLDALKGSSRPVVVLSDERLDPRVEKQIDALDHTQPELTKRNIKILTEAKPGSALRKKLGVEEKGFAVVLVGKDGSVKKVWHDPVDPKQIFTVIDSMPMRRNEMNG